MKNVSSLTILSVFFHLQFYSQANFLEYSLQAKDLKVVQKDNKTSWTVKAILTNHSRDTLFYFSTIDCEPENYLVDTIALFVDFQACDPAKQTVISVAPFGQRTVNLKISSENPIMSSFQIRIMMSIHKAKNINERIPENDLIRRKGILVVSNQVKT